MKSDRFHTFDHIWPKEKITPSPTARLTEDDVLWLLVLPWALAEWHQQNVGQYLFPPQNVSSQEYV